jgi:hypothetical protein
MPRVEMREAAAPARRAVENVRLLIIMVFSFGFSCGQAKGSRPAHGRDRSTYIGLLVVFGTVAAPSVVLLYPGEDLQPRHDRRPACREDRYRPAVMPDFP